ncbi:TonB-dependent receptor [Erythrobacter litoralis]|uniref:TonB-dependent receptor domain-containing protein n=1 Tax=Erythrobacter litoralis TaxID=39960 RepID=UPI002434AA5B|nr:TonB-dependent receptor [Erythrobacter litoralis]MDG6078854.1 TonB-dependent receptor [Erythrobacter litoralis]
MKTYYLNSACRFAFATAVLAVPGTAFAQAEAEQAGTTNTADTIVVTGSLIRGTPEDAALPVDVFNADELVKSGIDSPLEFIKELPSVGAVLGDTNQFATTAQALQGVGSLNLRGLGAERTLVLLNSARTILTPGEGFADTNLIPLFALERIELLKDGAASTYGSDAIGGVANFITRRNFEGVEVQGDYTFIDGSDGNYSVSGLVGFDAGGANIMVGAGWQHRSELGTPERDYTRLNLQTNPSAFSALSTPGLFAVTRLSGNPDNPATPGNEALATSVVRDVGCTELGGEIAIGRCYFTYVPFDNITEDEDRYQVYAQVVADLSDRTEITLTGLYAQSDLDSINQSPSFPPTQGPNGSGFVSAFTTSPNNPGVAAFLEQTGLAPASATNPVLAVTNVLYRPFGYLGNPRDPDRGAGPGSANNKAYRFTFDIAHELTDRLTLDGSLVFWDSNRERSSPGIIGSRLQNALNGLGGPDCDPATGTPGQGGCQFFNPFANAGPGNGTFNLDNPFYVPGNENSVDLIRYLQVANGVVQDEQQVVASAILSGLTGWELGGGEVAFAVGAQYRQNDYATRPLNPESSRDNNPCFVEGDLSCVGTTTEGVGPFIFLGVNSPVSLEQSVYALFAEVNLPVTDRIEIDGAIRFEDYGDPVGSTINPKGSARFEVTDFLTFRGSIGTTFRGPLAVDVADNQRTALQGFTAAGGNYKSLDIFGNPDVSPESALTYNVGAIIDTGGFTVSVDYWSIDLEDRITTTPGDAIASLVVSGALGLGDNNTPLADCSSPLAGFITFSNNQCVQGVTEGIDISRVRTNVVNGPDVNISGLDFATNLDVPFGAALLSLGGNATWNLNYEFDDFEVNGITVLEGYDAVGLANYFRDPNTIPEWRANAYANLNVAGFNARYSFIFIDSVRDERCDGVPSDTRPFCFVVPGSTEGSNFGATSGSYMQHDLNLTYDFAVGSSELTLQAGVNNIFDEEPAAAQLPLGYNPFIGNAIGRNYRIGLRARY